MSLAPIRFIISSDVTLTNGSRTITINDGIDASFVHAASAVQINNLQLVEAESGTAPSNGVSTITLREAWAGSNITSGSMVAFNTLEGLANAIHRIEQATTSTASIGDLPAASRGIVEKTGDTDFNIRNFATDQQALDGLTTEIPNVTQVRASFEQFGLGDLSMTPLTTDTQSINYGSFTSFTNAANNNHTGDAASVVTMPYSSSAAVQLQFGLNNRRVFASNKVANSWGQSYEFYTTATTPRGTDQDALDGTANALIDSRQVRISYRQYGLGTDTLNALTDINVPLSGGLYSYSAGATGSPDGGAGSLISLARSGSSFYHQLAVNNDNNCLHTRITESGVTSNWTTYYNDLNLNVNVFGNDTANQWIGQGVAISDSIVGLMLPISSPTSPISISIVSTFEAVRLGVGVVGDVTLGLSVAVSSGKVAYIQCSGLTGLTIGEPIAIRTKTNTSKITVNF